MSELTKRVRASCDVGVRPSLATARELLDEHDRLEGLLRAWHAARGDDESEAAIEMWREACRLVEEKPTSDAIVCTFCRDGINHERDRHCGATP